MTQTLDIAGRYSQLDSARAAATPAVETQTRSKFGVFAITFGIASTLLYTVFERLNWPLFTYLPRVNRVEFWMYRSPPAESPPMYWYGWIVLAAVAALVVSLIATRVSDQTLRRATFFCCVLGALWPTFLAVLRSFGPDWQALNVEFMNSVWAAAVPALNFSLSKEQGEASGIAGKSGGSSRARGTRCRDAERRSRKWKRQNALGRRKSFAAARSLCSY
jgi:hypothetical protein